MMRKKCPACGFVQNADNTACTRCNARFGKGAEGGRNDDGFTMGDPHVATALAAATPPVQVVPPRPIPRRWFWQALGVLCLLAAALVAASGLTQAYCATAAGPFWGRWLTAAEGIDLGSAPYPLVLLLLALGLYGLHMQVQTDIRAQLTTSRENR